MRREDKTTGNLILATLLATSITGWSARALAQVEPPPGEPLPAEPGRESPIDPATPVEPPKPPPPRAQPPRAQAPKPPPKAQPPAQAAPAAPPPAEEKQAPEAEQTEKRKPYQAVSPTAVTAPPPKQASSFTFGSYGRTVAGTDLRGRPGRDADIVARGSRLDESNYAELSLRRDDLWEQTGVSTRVVATLAVANPIFHYNGVFDARLAVRNLFLEAYDLGTKGLTAWAGSRMYRGDDIYLLDWWPLDNLNTIGAGARYALSDETAVALHAGLNQPDSRYFTQNVDRPLPLNQVGAASVSVLNRQKFISSAKVSHLVHVGEKGGIKGVGYGEFHSLPSGQRETTTGIFESLPSDVGFVLGAQVGGFTGERSTHLNLFLRYAWGLAAYGELNTPVQLGPDYTAAGAHELLAALGGSWENEQVGVMFAAYLRSFRNASPDLDFHDLDEGIVLARPQLYFGKIGGLAVEASYQAQQRGVLFVKSQLPGSLDVPTGPNTASLVRFGVMPFLTPTGPGNYARPHLRLIYAVTFRNDPARQLYPQDDVFGLRSTEQFLGFGSEWWFDAWY